MMLYLFLGLVLIGCALMFGAIFAPRPRLDQAIYHSGLIAAALGAMGLLAMWQEGAS